MKANVDRTDSSRIADPSAIKVTIIYEDFASGTWAKRFAERLSEHLECHCPLAGVIWRSDLLEYPPLAERAARAAAECEYLIVSLRGNRVLPFATRQWIEAQLDGAADRGMGLVLLSDFSQGKWRVVKATRHYLRSACAARDVVFFSQSMTPLVKEALALKFAGRRQLPALLPD